MEAMRIQGVVGGDGLLAGLGQRPVSVEPHQCALDVLAPGQDLDALGAVGSLDDADGPFPTRRIASLSVSPA